MPAGLAALLVVLGLLGSLALTFRLVAPTVRSQVPELTTAASESLTSLQEWAAESSLPVDVSEPTELLAQVRDAVAGDDPAARGFEVAAQVVDVATGTLLLLVALFFYLRDGRRMWRGVLDLVPARHQHAVDDAAGRVWWTLGAYFRGQLLVAAFDAVFIGLGLVLLGVPLAVPLAVVVFLGGLFPIVGAFVSGLLAVLVALADSGVTTALLVLGLVVLVQQVESNVLEPLVLSRVIALHPFVVIVSIAAGAVLLGVLGAFLAVPVAASIARTVDYVRGRTPETGPGSEGDDAGGDDMTVSRRTEPARGGTASDG